jgi:hypothetical protein
VAANNGTATISVTFTPKALLGRNATLTIVNDATNTVVTLTGTGTQPGISAPALVFANQPVGTTSANTPLTITNSGTAPLHITGLSIATNPAEFAVTNAALEIAPGANANVNVRFTPSDIGNRTGTLSISSDAPGSPTTVSLSGLGTAARVGPLSPVTFGNQLITVPATSKAGSLTISNTGNMNLLITNLSIGGTNPGDFSFGAGFILPTPGTPITVAANTSTTIPLLFTPVAAGNRSATLSITDNASGSPHSATLSGIGTIPGAPVFNPTPVTFNQIVGTTSAVVAVTVTNPASATGDLNISAISISGANASDFATTTVAPINGIVPGGSTTINLRFTPGAVGARIGLLTITDNAPGGSHSVNLNGTGSVSNISPTALTFSSQLVGTASAAQPVTFAYPAGASGTLALNSVAVSGTNSADFTVSAGVLPANLTAPGQSRAINVTFTPAVAGGGGPRSATLTLTDSTGTYTVGLSGTATAPAVSVPGSLLFADQAVNTTSSATPLTITNSGTANLHISSVSISGTNSSEFSAATLPPSGIDILPGANANISLSFTPSARGLRTATLNIVDNAAGSPHHVTLNGTGIAPVIAVTPNPVAFGNQTVNISSSTRPVTISNTGDSPLHISNIATSGANPTEFTFTPSAPLTIAAGASTSVNVTFKPTTAAAKTATLTFTSDAVSGVNSISLTGTGVLPGLSANPSPVQFADQLINTASAPLTITITNTGLGTALITDLSISGLNLSDFTFPAGFTMPTPTSPITVAANGGTTTLSLIFTPTKVPEGAETATLTITSNASPLPVTLNGTGIAPHFSAPSPLNFGLQEKGVASAARTVTITNSGGADLTITALGITGPNGGDFALSPAPAVPITVPKNNGTVTVSVVFTPSTNGVLEVATLNFNDNASGSPHAVTLNGTGAAPVMGTLSLSPFGTVDVGSTSTPKNLTVTNSGNWPMRITGLSFSGANATDFATSTVATPEAPITVAAGGTTTISVTFTPLAAGTRSASLVIADNAAGSPHSVALSGTGNPVPIFSVNPSALAFPDTILGTSSGLPLVITNTGQANLRITAITKNGPNASEFIYSVSPPGFGDCSTSAPCDIAPGASRLITFTFQPVGTTVGNRTATFFFTDNTGPGGTSGVHAISASGNATAPSPNVSFSPIPLTFIPDQLVGTTSPQSAITATNSGTANLNITGLSLSGPNASEFSIVTATPITVPKAVGGTNGTAGISLRFTPTSTGTRTATLNITAVSAFDNSPVTVAPIAISGTGFSNGDIVLNPASLGSNLEILALGYLTRPPQSQALTVTTTSSDPTKVLLLPVATDSTGTTLGTASFTSSVPVGHGTLSTGGLPGFWIQALASSGTVNITVSAPGYVSAVTPITLTPSGFVLNGPAGAGVNFTATLGAGDVPLTVSPVQLDSAGNVLSSTQRLRGGAAGFVVNVTVTSGTTAIATILGNPAVMQPATTVSGSVNFHPKAGGTTLLRVNPQPAGFTAPASGAQLTATVSAPTITLNPVTVGFNQQAIGVGQINRTQATALSVTIVSDSASVLLATSPTAVGTGSITVSVPPNTTSLPPFYINAAGTAGSSAILTASATNFSSGTANVAVTGSAFILMAANGQPLGNFTTTTISFPTSLTVGFWQLDSLSRPLSQGVLRPGQSASVAVTSGTTSTGTIAGSPALFSAGESTNTSLSFQPQANCTTPCTTTLSVAQPAGYNAPASGGQLTVTVNKPTVTLLAPTPIIGQNLQVFASGTMDATYPDNLVVDITSDNPNVLLAPVPAPGNPVVQGTQTLRIIVPTGSGMSGSFPSYYVQSLAASGVAHLTATVKKFNLTDAGFNVTPVTVTLRPAGFVLDGGNGVGGTIGASSPNGASVHVIAVVLDPDTLAPTAVEQPVRGGFAASVSVVSGGPAATISGSPVTIGSNSSRGVVTVNSISPSPGVVVGIPPTPTGFSQPSSGSSLMVVTN